MPERFESGVYSPEDAKLLKDAFDEAWPRVEPVGKDRELARQLLATAVIDQVESGVRDRDEIVEVAIAMLAAAGRAAK